MQTAQTKTQPSEPVFSLRDSKHLEELAQLLLANGEYVLEQWLPDGQTQGKEYKARNPRRDDTKIGSFSINTTTGVWADFATDDKGGNLAELFAYLNAIEDTPQLILELEAFCQSHGLTLGQRKTKQRPAKVKPATESIPAEDMAWLPPDSDADGNRVTATWEYRTFDNEVLFYVLRTEPEPGQKETKPCRLSGGRWVWSYPESKLPLLNVHKFQKNDVVFFGEGEKVAMHLDNWHEGIGMTSAGGSNRLFASDLSPLKKAGEVIVFPDADPAGIKYATQLVWFCQAHGIPCRVLDTEAFGWSGSEDAADHPELGFAEYMENLLSAEAWCQRHADVSDEALFEVIGAMTNPDYDRTAKHLASLTSLSLRTLHQERKRLRKPEHAAGDEDDEEDVADIDLPAEVKEERRAALFPLMADLANAPDILDRVVRVCQETLGVFNETAQIKLGYLCAVSRLLDSPGDRPASLMLKGSSGAGKSFVIKQVLKLFRVNESWIHLSSVSAKGLIYDQRSYRGKVIFMPECNQLIDQDSLLTQLVKTILTEGCIEHLTVDTGESRFPEGRVITKRGPIALILGTVRDYLDAELETRALSYYVDESSEQTRNIILNAANRVRSVDHQDEAQIDAVRQPWLAFDEWVALSPVRKVVIPFYHRVVAPITDMPIRYRRDLVETVPALIKASALIHQTHRQVIDGAIQASPDDYELVRVLVNDFLHRVQGDTATPTMLRLLGEIYRRMPDEVRQGKSTISISQPELAVALGITQQAVGYQLKKLLEKGYLQNSQMITNRPAKLKPGPAFSPEILAEQAGVLLTAETLRLYERESAQN